MYVQTPQVRATKCWASRGSRPWSMISMPRNIVPELQAFVTLPPATSTSTLRLAFDTGYRVDCDSLCHIISSVSG